MVALHVVTLGLGLVLGAMPTSGSISGTVVNASRGGASLGGAEVALRVEVQGQLVLAAETTTDEQGRFAFKDIPANPTYVYLPGANWQTVHYPGPRIRLDDHQPDARVEIAVHDAVESPSPLVVASHEIVIEPQPGSLRVTESLVIDNPGSTTYIGRPAENSSRAATLRLSIPPGFDRTTFHQEFFGRRFTLIDDQLVTDVPWTPGTRKLSVTYVMSNSQKRRTWERPLDLPTKHVRVVVRSDKPAEVSCSLPQASSHDSSEVAFAADDLSTEKRLWVEFGQLPLPLFAHARWVAMSCVAMLMVGTVVYLRRRAVRSQVAPRLL